MTTSGLALPALRTCVLLLWALPLSLPGAGTGTAWALNDGLPPAPRELDRTNPLATVQGFLNAAHHGDYPLAAHYLNLDGVAEKDQALKGPRLARRLRFVLDRQLA